MTKTKSKLEQYQDLKGIEEVASNFANISIYLQEQLRLNSEQFQAYNQKAKHLRDELGLSKHSNIDDLIRKEQND